MTSLDEDDGRHDENHQGHQHDESQQPHLTRSELVKRRDHGPRQAHHDPGEDDERHPVPDATFGDLLTQPHDEGRTGRQGQHGQQPEPPAGLIDERQAPHDVGLAFQEDGDPHRLHDAQEDGAVAGILRDLPAPELTFFGEPLEVRPDHCQQLEDDRGADVRHDPQCEDRHIPQIPTREHVVQAEHRVTHLLHEEGQRLGIDTRCRNMPPQAKDPEQGEREQHTLPQIGNGKDALQALDHLSRSSVVSRQSSISPQSPVCRLLTVDGRRSTEV